MQLLGIAMLGLFLIVAVAATVREMGWVVAAQCWAFTIGLTGFIVIGAGLATGAIQ